MECDTPLFVRILIYHTLVLYNQYTMNKIITFQISKGEDGYYVASADDVSIFTQGKTFEALLRNIREAVEVSFDGFSGKRSKHVFPPVMMNMDFSEVIHA